MSLDIDFRLKLRRFLRTVNECESSVEERTTFVVFNILIFKIYLANESELIIYF